MSLTQHQIVLFNDFKDDIEFYKEELSNQIRNKRILSIVSVGSAVILALIITLFPSILEPFTEMSEHLGTMTGVAGEIIPVTFASKYFNNSNLVRKKLKGLRVFEKSLNRMEAGILPNTEDDILNLEQELIRYINT